MYGFDGVVQGLFVHNDAQVNQGSSLRYHVDSFFVQWCKDFIQHSRLVNEVLSHNGNLGFACVYLHGGEGGEFLRLQLSWRCWPLTC